MPDSYWLADIILLSYWLVEDYELILLATTIQYQKVLYVLSDIDMSVNI